MKTLLVGIAVVLFSIISQSSFAKELVNINELPEWVQKEMAKEKKVRKKTKLVYEPLGIDKKVKGKISSEQDVDSTRYYTIDIGTVAPIECYIFHEFDGAANSLKNVVEAGIGASAEANQKPLTDSFNYALNSGSFDSIPFLSLESLYTLGEGKDKAVGLIKGISAKVNEVLPMCVHNELGYRQTFYAVAESFINAVADAKTSDAFFEIVYSFSINGLPLGFATEHYALDADGDVEAIIESSMLIPADAQSISSSDSVTKSWSEINGDLINAYSESIENGAYAFAYSLTFEDGAWVSDGESQGKTQSFTLKYDGPLMSNHGSYLKAAELLASKQQSGDYIMWMPDADPSRATNMSISKILEDKKHNLEYVMGPITVRAMTDKEGVSSAGSMTQGPITVEMMTLHSKGQPGKLDKKLRE